MKKYTMKDLFGFMDAKRPVRVTCTDGRVFEGPCWAYGDVQNEEEYGVAEPLGHECQEIRSSPGQF